jgi:hypothetical protein
MVQILLVALPVVALFSLIVIEKSATTGKDTLRRFSFLSNRIIEVPYGTQTVVVALSLFIINQLHQK